MTRDGGKHWANVTPPKAPEWGRLQQIEVSPFAPGTAYVALDYHEVENNKPYVFKTHDYGKTWTSIANGLPGNDPARVVRENPNQKGMLVLGTDTGLFYSHDEGEHWTPLKSNFPTAPIYDLKFHKANHDLIVATHGRGLFVLDDITPLEETSAQVLAQDFHLYSSQPGVKWRLWSGEKHGFSARGDFSAPNPRRWRGDFVLPGEDAGTSRGDPAARTRDGRSPPCLAPRSGRGRLRRARQERGSRRTGRGIGARRGGRAGERRAACRERAEPAGEGNAHCRGPVKIVVTDADGQVVRTLYGPGKQGLNRVTWNMRYDDAKRLNSARRPDEENEFFNPGGPAALPGQYKVAVTAAGKTENTEVAVEADPRMPFDMEAGRAQLQQALELRGWMNAMNESLNRIDSLKSQIATVQRLLGPEAENSGVENVAYQPVLAQARALRRKLSTVEETVFNVARGGRSGRRACTTWRAPMTGCRARTARCRSRITRRRLRW